MTTPSHRPSPPRIDTPLTRQSHVVQSFVEQGVALWDPKRNQFFHLNDTGAEIWQHLGQPSDPASIARKLARDFDGDPSELLADVRRLLADFVRHGLVEPAR